MRGRRRPVSAGRPRVLTSALVVMLALAACSGDTTDDSGRDGSPTATPPPTASSPGPTATSTSPAPSGSDSSAPPVAFDPAAAMATVREVASVGPREATSAAYRQAAELVAARFEELGYLVTRDRFRVPAGNSWGVAVDAGRTSNVVARPADVAADAPHLVVGAHLDTVPQAPGAEDNASGVAVVLELARLASEAGTRLPVTFVAFGAEEPRGPADDEHHFGSLRYAARDAGPSLTAMVSLDRVGTGDRVPLCFGGLGSRRVRSQLREAAERVDVATRVCENRTSDHWPFEKAGYDAARVGGNDYAAYHSSRDLPRVVDQQQLDKVGRVVWEWLRVPD